MSFSSIFGTYKLLLTCLYGEFFWSLSIYKRMTTYLVLTIIGEDRPGIVESLAEIISDHSGNWLAEQYELKLAGKFAGILRAAVKEDKCEALINSLENSSKISSLLLRRFPAKTMKKSVK